jgi:DNA-binding transcriptional ArsR family regulator
MKPFMVIRDPEAYALLADETRRKILYLLRVKEMTATQIAEQLGITSQAVYHHIRKLLKGKMVEVVREERIGHLIESAYMATAEDFLLSTGKITAQNLRNRELAKEQITAVLNALKKLGLNLEFDEKQISQLVDSRVGLEHACIAGAEKYEDKIWNMDDLDLPMRMMAADFVDTILMSNDEFNKRQNARKKLRDQLLSLIKNGGKSTH